MLSQPRKLGSPLVAAMLIIAGFTLSLQAQSGQLNFTGSPNYGEVRLQANFTPDPHLISVTAGGTVNASYLPGACMGWAAASPDYRITWSGSSEELRILFESESGNEDATLIINLPDGSWVCNDDAMDGTLDPMITLSNPANGQYDVWVGSLSEGDYIGGMLIVTEYPFSPGDYDWRTEMSGESNASLAGANLLDFTAEPTFGSVELQSGFSPDPHTVGVAAGGFVQIAESNAAMAGCRGYATTNPDFKLHWDGSTDALRIFFEAETPGEDAVLVINTPSGEWICNDDAADYTLNPQVLLSGFESGRYDIWVASFEADAVIGGTLSITELDINAE